MLNTAFDKTNMNSFGWNAIWIELKVHDPWPRAVGCSSPHGGDVQAAAQEKETRAGHLLRALVRPL